MRNLKLLLPALLLSACGPAHISVRYPAPASPQESARAKALANAYLLIAPPPRLSDSALGRQIQKIAAKIHFTGDRLFDYDAGALAKAIARAVEAGGGEIVAYRVGSEAPDPYVKLLSPTGILRVSLDTFSVKQTRYEKEISKRDSKTKKITKQVAVFWKHEAQLHGSMHFASYPEGVELGRSDFTAKHAGDIQAQNALEAKQKWLKKAWPGLLAAAARHSTAGIGKTTVVSRGRTLFVDKEDPGSKAAAKLARGGKWESASALWARRLEEDRGDWRDLMNLALASERVRLYGEARRIYQKAKSAAGNDPEAAKIPWSQIDADLNAVSDLAIGRAQAAREWFAAPVAVLPFSDATTSVVGPEMLRKMVWEALHKGGYTMIDLEGSDRALRTHGYSMGGQLHKGKPHQFAGWTGASRILYGDIVEFRNVMLGPFGRRIVAGTLRLWDAPSKDWLWKAEEPVVNGSGADISQQIGRAFLESWMRKPLGPESKEFVRINLETLPLRPPRK